MTDLDDAVRWLRANDPMLVELNLQCRHRRPDGAYNRKIFATGATKLAESISVNSTLSVLDLTGHEISDTGAESLGRSLRINSSINTLLLA